MQFVGDFRSFVPQAIQFLSLREAAPVFKTHQRPYDVDRGNLALIPCVLLLYPSCVYFTTIRTQLSPTL
jgi:hypothetical protein